MARDREERYPSAAEFGRALERWLITEKAGVADNDVALTLKGALGDHIDGIRQKIDAAITAIESGAAETLPSPDEEPVTVIAPSATPQGGRTLGGAALTDITEKRLVPERRNTFLLGVGFAAVAVLAFLGIGKLTNHDLTAKSAGPAATVPPTAAPSASPPAVTSATAAATAAPTLPANDASTVATAETSASAAPSVTTRGPGGRRYVVKQPVTTTVTTPVPPASTVHPGDVQPPPKKRTRVLDDENPFATE